MRDLIDDVFCGAFDNPLLAPLEDQARVDLAGLAARGDRLAITTDSFVVNWSLSHYLYAALTASVIVIFASLAPARRAARLVPGDVIRGTAL